MLGAHDKIIGARALHLLGRKLWQHFAENFHGTLHVGLDDNRQLLDFAGLELLVELVQGYAPAAAARHRSIALLALTVLDNVPGLRFVGHLEVIARFWHSL